MARIVKPVNKAAWDAKENAGPALQPSKLRSKEASAVVAVVQPQQTQKCGTLRRAAAAATTGPSASAQSEANRTASVRTTAARTARELPVYAGRDGDLARSGPTARRTTPARSGTTSSGNPARSAATAKGGVRRGRPDPWAQVRAIEAKADEEEALIAELEAELLEAETALEKEKAALLQVEEELTSASATCLAEYTEKHAMVTTLESEEQDVRSRLDEVRGQNLNLMRQNVALDKEATILAERLAEDQALLRKVSDSQGLLDREIEELETSCGDLRVAADSQGERFAREWHKFEAMKARLQGIVTTSAADVSVQAQLLFPVADDIMARLEELRMECREVADGDVLLPDRQEEAAQSIDYD